MFIQVIAGEEDLVKRSFSLFVISCKKHCQYQASVVNFNLV